MIDGRGQLPEPWSNYPVLTDYETVTIYRNGRNYLDALVGQQDGWWTAGVHMQIGGSGGGFNPVAMGTVLHPRKMPSFGHWAGCSPIMSYKVPHVRRFLTRLKAYVNLNYSNMKRALNVRDILNKKYKVFPLRGNGVMLSTLRNVRAYGSYGGQGNGKSSFVMQLCKELCKYDRVAFNSLEEGTCLTVQNSLKRFGMAEVSRRLNFIKEDIPSLRERLRRHKSYNIVIIDSFQYTQMTYKDYIQLKEEFPDKLFIFISHARGKNPKGDAATSVMYDADLKIWVEGHIAFSKGRYQGDTGKYTIWDQGAIEYWGRKFNQIKNRSKWIHIQEMRSFKYSLRKAKPGIL